MDNLKLNKKGRVYQNYELWAGLFLIALGICASVMAYRLDLGSFKEPKSGLFPFVTALILCLMSIGFFIRNLFKSIVGNERGILFERIKWGKIIVMLVSLVLYGLILEVVGFKIDTFLLMTFLIGFVGHQKWWVTLIISFIIAISSHLLFVALLGCSFPQGFFGI